MLRVGDAVDVMRVRTEAGYETQYGTFTIQRIIAAVSGPGYYVAAEDHNGVTRDGYVYNSRKIEPQPEVK